MGRFEMRVEDESKELWKSAAGVEGLSKWAQRVLDSAALGLSPAVASSSERGPSVPEPSVVGDTNPGFNPTLLAGVYSSACEMGDPDEQLARFGDWLNPPETGPSLHRGRGNDQTHKMVREGRGPTRDLGPEDPPAGTSPSSEWLSKSPGLIVPVETVPDSVLMHGDPGGGLQGVEDALAPKFPIEEKS